MVRLFGCLAVCLFVCLFVYFSVFLDTRLLGGLVLYCVKILQVHNFELINMLLIVKPGGHKVNKRNEETGHSIPLVSVL